MIIGAAVFAAILAACGTSHSSSSGSPTTTTVGGSAPVVTTATNPQLGAILVDANGATLYTLTNNGQAVPCTSGACVAAWPPLYLSSGVTTPTGVNDLGTAQTPGGTLVTHAGLPLYRFAGDSAPGQANGDGIANFGGVWHVVTSSGASSSSGAVTPSTTSSSGSGYGY
jgi:predicted lipoprotein with Yx(FWY)xxD motif